MFIENYLHTRDKLNSKKSYSIAFCILCILLLYVTQINMVSAGTGINQQIPYSGSLVNNAGVVLPDNNYRAKFVLWDALSGGTQIYQEFYDGINSNPGTGLSVPLPISDGRFDILLGSRNTTFPTITNNDTLFLEIQLDMDNNGSYEEVFAPRRRIGSTVSAINALRLVAPPGGTDTDTLSLDIAGNVIASSLGGVANGAAGLGFDRVLLANNLGQFSQVNISTLGGWGLLGNATTDAWNGTTGTYLGTTSAQPLVLATTNATAQDIRLFTGVNGANERMRITGIGNVGIGTTAPQARLDIGTGRLTGGTNSATYRSYIDMSGNSDFPAVDTVFPGGDSATSNAGAGRGVFRAAQVSIAGTNDIFFQAIPLTSAGFGYVESYLSAGLALGTGGNTSPIVFRPNRTEVMRIQANGNVGIGTTNPLRPLSVAGNAQFGTNTSTAIATPINVSLGGTYGNSTPGSAANLKLTVYDDGTPNWYGIGMSTNLMEFRAGANGELGFFPNNGAVEALRIKSSGNVGIGTTSPTAWLNLRAGTATANTAPLKFTAGINLTTPEAGAVEWDGANLFLTTSGAVRQTINQGLTATATLDFPSTNNDSFSDLTVAVANAALNDVVSLGIPNGSVPTAATNFSAWVSAAGTVTIRFTNNSGVAQDPASGSFKVFVTK
jgi:hypothetical protein